MPSPRRDSLEVHVGRVPQAAEEGSSIEDEILLERVPLATWSTTRNV